LTNDRKHDNKRGLDGMDANGIHELLRIPPVSDKQKNMKRRRGNDGFV